MPVPAPTDPQSRAYRDSTDDDHWDGDVHALIDHGATVHGPLDDITQLHLPDDYESGGGWDSERQNPKTIDEARRALAARIADPAAPDSPAEAGAYDEED